MRNENAVSTWIGQRGSRQEHYAMGSFPYQNKCWAKESCISETGWSPNFWEERSRSREEKCGICKLGHKRYLKSFTVFFIMIYLQVKHTLRDLSMQRSALRVDNKSTAGVISIFWNLPRFPSIFSKTYARATAFGIVPLAMFKNRGTRVQNYCAFFIHIFIGHEKIVLRRAKFRWYAQEASPQV